MNDTLTPTSVVDDPRACLEPRRFVDSDAPAVRAYARRAAGDAPDAVEKARRLYYAVRDDLRYNPYIRDLRPEAFTASATLGRGEGFCVTKAAVLAAAARAERIPARLGYADVRNHLTSPKLKKLMRGSDVFAFHGYTELYLGCRWIKATPAFNLSLCRKAGILPLDFDGEHDSIFHPFDAAGRRHMEYLRYRGVYLDVPLAEILRCFVETYGVEPAEFAAAAGDGRDFEREVVAESEEVRHRRMA